LLLAILTPSRWVVPVVAVSSLVLLAALGALAARVGGAHAGKAALRVGLLGSMAMGLSVAVGSLFGAGL
jgi:VIT1/CCC1 family predicted Fe2+/Mn2+ transporter